MAAGFRVELKLDVGSSEIVHEALTGGALDMYPEYVGVLLSEIARVRERPRDPRAAYLRALAFEKRMGFTLLERTPFSDSNALAVTPAFARRHRLRTIAELRRVPGRIDIGAPPEFGTRYEGIIGLRSVYGLRRLALTPLTIGRQYAALGSGRVDAAAVFTTDGQLAERRYVVLKDPRHVFASQQVAPVISEAVLRRHGPALRTTINAVSRRLTTKAIREMNAAVELRGQKPAVVAARFLRSAGLD